MILWLKHKINWEIFIVIKESGKRHNNNLN
jgi:hypothetical protein